MSAEKNEEITEREEKLKIERSLLYLAADMGKVPSGEDVAEHCPELSFKRMKEIYGSFNQALKSAGIDKWTLHKNQRDWEKSKHEIIREKYLEFIRKHT